MLSGLLKCVHRGSSYSISGVDRYSCAGHASGGNTLCANEATLRRQVVEAEVTVGLKRDLSDPLVIDEVCRQTRAALRAPSPGVDDHGARITQLKAEIDNLADAVASGAFRSSPALASRLATAEVELKRLEASEAVPRGAVDVMQLLAGLPTSPRF